MLCLGFSNDHPGGYRENRLQWEQGGWREREPEGAGLEALGNKV